ncbi:MAG: T9SS type A sorting domain-containing protein [Bacteroidota bacterium]
MEQQHKKKYYLVLLLTCIGLCNLPKLGAQAFQVRDSLGNVIPGNTLLRQVGEHMHFVKDHSTDDQYFGLSKFSLEITSENVGLGPAFVSANQINGKFFNGTNTVIPVQDLVTIEAGAGSGGVSGGVSINAAVLFGQELDFVTVRASGALGAGTLVTTVFDAVPILRPLANSPLILEVKRILNSISGAAGGTRRLDILPITKKNPIFSFRIAQNVDRVATATLSTLSDPRLAGKEVVGKTGTAFVKADGRQWQFSIWHIEAITGIRFSDEVRAAFDSTYDSTHPLHTDFIDDEFIERAILADSLKRARLLGSGRAGEPVSISSTNASGPFPDRYILNNDGSLRIRRKEFLTEEDPEFWEGLGISPSDNDGGTATERANLGEMFPTGASNAFEHRLGSDADPTLLNLLFVRPRGAEIDSTGNINFIFSGESWESALGTPSTRPIETTLSGINNDFWKQLFLQGLMIPGDNNWVDIRQRPDNIVPEGGFERTKLGQLFLHADRLLKSYAGGMIGRTPLNEDRPPSFQEFNEIGYNRFDNIINTFYGILDTQYPNFTNFTGVEVVNTPGDGSIIQPPTIDFKRNMFLRKIEPNLRVDGRILITPKVIGKMDANRILIDSVDLQVDIVEVYPKLVLKEYFKGRRSSVSVPADNSNGVPISSVPVTQVLPDNQFSLDNEGQGIIYESEFVVYLDALNRINETLQVQVEKTRDSVQKFVNNNHLLGLEWLGIFEDLKNGISAMAIAEWYKHSNLKKEGALQELIDIQPQLVEFGGNKEATDYLPEFFDILFPVENGLSFPFNISTMRYIDLSNIELLLNNFDNGRVSVPARSFSPGIARRFDFAYNNRVNAYSSIPAPLRVITGHSLSGGIVGLPDILVDVVEEPLTDEENADFDITIDEGVIAKALPNGSTHLVAGGGIAYNIAEISPVQIYTENNTPGLIGFNGEYLEGRPIGVEVEVANNGNRAATNIPVTALFNDEGETPVVIDTGVIAEIPPYETARYGFIFDPGPAPNDQLTKTSTLTFEVNRDRSIPELSYENNSLGTDLIIDYIISNDTITEATYHLDVDLLEADQAYFVSDEQLRYNGVSEVPANSRLTTHATERLIMEPGFRAVSGSYFRGYIDTDDDALAEYNRLFPSAAPTNNGNGLPPAANTSSLAVQSQRQKVFKNEMGDRFKKKKTFTKPYIVNLKDFELDPDWDKVETFKSQEAVPRAINKLYPNPSKGNTNLEFELKAAREVSITLYNMANQKIKDLVTSKALQAGRHSETFDVSDVPNGLYIIVIESDGVFLDSKFMFKEQ